ncbi:SMP-30/gluconolactonase/LRE family protein [Candidatus Solirubrobacter pratensis]|uniref:SMP-30/gluconolactonase/LRE family protein n=1 Tax=Candidatus Solirubrobacter pratensis TaxID=1298857 RepID=UPI0004059F94|nr:SMP-30/gluconolactonase/LRE family protein [Candidatus Solirubrobacter pratensis]
MGARELVTLLSGGHYFEGPRWRDGRWWVSDFYRHTVLTVQPDGRAEAVLTLEGGAQPSGLGWLPDGSLLVVSMRDHRLLRLRDGELSVHAELGEHCSGLLNDMVVAEDGTAYVGNFGFDLMGGADARHAKLLRVAPDGAVSVAAEDLIFPNGAVIDGSTLLVNETLGGRITAFGIEPGGSLGNRRVWAQLQPTPAVGPLDQMLAGATFAPDGLTLDAEGHVWAANALGGPVARISPAGEVVDTIAPPEGLAVFAYMLGGPEGNTLLMCAAPDFAEESRKAAREALLLTTTVEVPAA